MTQLDLTQGSLLPSFVRHSGFESWNRFAAVNHEFVPIHMDDEAGRKAGFAGAIGMGNLQWAYYHNLLRTWLGGRGRIERVSVRFQEPNLKDTQITVRARIAGIDRADEGTRVTIELWAEDNQQRKLSSGEAKVMVFA